MKKNLILIILGIILCLGLVSADTCTETDSGDDPYTIGTNDYTNSSSNSSIGYTVDDSCTLSSIGYASCIEYYCSGTSLRSKSYYCDSVTPTACDTTISTSNSYTESDGGNYPLVAGYLTLTTDYTFSFGTYTSSSIAYYDRCYTSGTYNGKLREYYLSGTITTSTYVDCTSSYGPSIYSCMTDASGYGYCGAPIVEEICRNAIDDDGNGLIDTTGGCDSNGDNSIDYICGCAKYNKKTKLFISFTSYGSYGSASCPSGLSYACKSLLDNTTTGVTCGVGEDIEGIYYNPDSVACPITTLSRAGEVEEGFFARFWNWLVFWD